MPGTLEITAADSPELVAVKEYAARELQWAQMKIQVLEERLRKQRIAKYGPGSEKLENLQLDLLEAEPGVSAQEVEAEATRETEVLVRRTKQPRKDHPGRQELPAELPRVEKVIPLPVEQCTCKACGEGLAVIGHESSEQLDVEPAKYFVLVTKREKRACAGCSGGGVKTAAPEPRIVDKSLVSDRVIIDTVVAKYADHRVPRTRRRQCRRGAVEEMRVGPSKSAIRSRLQTTVSCCR